MQVAASMSYILHILLACTLQFSWNEMESACRMGSWKAMEFNGYLCMLTNSFKGVNLRSEFVLAGVTQWYARMETHLFYGVFGGVRKEVISFLFVSKNHFNLDNVHLESHPILLIFRGTQFLNIWGTQTPDTSEVTNVKGGPDLSLL